jgi:hypothetical protein
MFNFALSSQDDSKMIFAKVLEENMIATQSLVTKLAEMNGDSGRGIGQEDAFRQCQNVTSEVRGFGCCVLDDIPIYYP